MHIERYIVKGDIKIVVKKIEVNGGAVIMKGIDINKLRDEKKFVTVSTKEALKDVTPINWSKEVLDGKRKVEIDFMKN